MSASSAGSVEEKTLVEYSDSDEEGREEEAEVVDEQSSSCVVDNIRDSREESARKEDVAIDSLDVADASLERLSDSRGEADPKEVNAVDRDDASNAPSEKFADARGESAREEGKSVVSHDTTDASAKKLCDGEEESGREKANAVDGVDARHASLEKIADARKEDKQNKGNAVISQHMTGASAERVFDVEKESARKKVDTVESHDATDASPEKIADSKDESVDEANEDEIAFLVQLDTLENFECTQEADMDDRQGNSTLAQHEQEAVVGAEEDEDGHSGEPIGEVPPQDEFAADSSLISPEFSATVLVARGRYLPNETFSKTACSSSPLRFHASSSSHQESTTPEHNRNSLRSRTFGPVVETPPLSDAADNDEEDMSPISSAEESEPTAKKEVSDSDYQPPSTESKPSRNRLRKLRKRASKRKRESDSASPSDEEPAQTVKSEKKKAAPMRKKARKVEAESDSASVSVERSSRRPKIPSKEVVSSKKKPREELNESISSAAIPRRSSRQSVKLLSKETSQEDSDNITVDEPSADEVDVDGGVESESRQSSAPRPSSFDPPVKRARGRPRKSLPLAGCVPVAGVGAKKRRALPKVASSLFVDANSNTADALDNAISGLFAFVPPKPSDDETRAVKTPAELDSLIASFIDNQQGFEILFEELHHEERLHVIRQLVTLAFGDEHKVEPFLRLMRENTTRLDDPWHLVVSALSDALIDTRRATMTSSFQSLIFAYASVLFLQRWGIMPAGTTAYAYWGLLGLRFQNWDKIGLWTEFFALSPVLVTAIIEKLLTTRSLNMHKEFQFELLKVLLEDDELLRHWYFLRRFARTVYQSKTGQSLLVDLLPIDQMWIYRGAIIPKIDELEEEYESLSDAERATFLQSVTQYPDSTIYRESVATVSDLLVSANSDSFYARKVAFYIAFQRQLEDLPSETWLKYEGDDTIRRLAVGILNKLKIDLCETTIGDNCLILKFLLQDETESTEEETLQFDLPLPEDIIARLRNTQRTEIFDIDADSPLEEPQVSRPASHTATNSVVDSILITDFLTEQTEDELCASLLDVGRVREVTIDRRVGQVLLRFATEIDARRVLLCLSACSFDSISPVCIAGTSFELGQLFAHTAQVATDLASVKSNFSRFPSKNELKTALENLSQNIDSEKLSVPSICMEALTQLSLEDSLLQTSSPFLSDEAIGGLLSTDSGQAYSLSSARQEFARLPCATDEEARLSLVFLLREVAAAHLRQHPRDLLDVAPCDWLKMDGDIISAAEGKLLVSASRGSRSLADFRCVLFGDIVDGLPVVVILFYPNAFAQTTCSLFSPTIFIFGFQLSPSSLRNVLLTLFWRLDCTGQEFLQSGRCCLWDLESSSGTLSPVEIIWKLAHAVHVSLALSSSPSSSFFSSRLFRDDENWKKTQHYFQEIWASNDTASGSDSSKFDTDWVSLNSKVVDEEDVAMVWLSTVYQRLLDDFLWRRHLRSQCDETWSEDTVLFDTRSLDDVRSQLIVRQLQQVSSTLKLALFKRIQQLFRQGFKLCSVASSFLTFKRNPNEFVVMKELDYMLRAGANIYSIEEERDAPQVRFESVPVW